MRVRSKPALFAPVLIAFAWLVGVSAASAQDLSGVWELQAIGQDGTSIQVEHDKDVIVLYRVMQPEFEGQKYTLEHVYKGRIIGKKVSGNLLVRDDQKLPFESLRPFDGELKSDQYIIIDDLPLKLSKAGKQTIPVQLPDKKKRKRGETPPVGFKEPTPEESIPSTAQAQEASNPDVALLEGVLGSPGGSILEISARIRLPSPADDYQKLGDKKQKEGKLEEAAAQYEKAIELDPKRLELYGKLGNLYLRLQKYSEAKQHFQHALRFDPHNKALKKQLAKVAAKAPERGG